MLKDIRFKRNSITFKLFAILLLISVFLSICVMNYFNNLDINSSGTVLMVPESINSQGGNLKKTSRRYYDKPIFLNKCWEVFPYALDNNLLKYINNHTDSSNMENFSKYYFNISIPYIHVEDDKNNIATCDCETNSDITGEELKDNKTDINPDIFFDPLSKTIDETITYSLFINIGQDINFSNDSEDIETPYLIIPFQENKISKVIIDNTKRDTNATHYGLYAGYTAYPITESHDNHITINIEVTTGTNSKYVGLTHAPFIVNSKCLQKMNLLSMTTLFIPILLIFLSFIVGLLIIQTFNKKINFFIFIALSLLFILYSMIDGHYIIINDLFVSDLIKNLLIITSLNACNFLLFSFFKPKQQRNKIYKNLIPLLEAIVGFFIILPYTLFSFPSTSYQSKHFSFFFNLDILNIYIILISLIAFIRIIISIRKTQYDFLAYITSLSAFFIFLFIKHDNSKMIYYTPTYILFFIVMLLIIISYFAYRYVSEFNRAHLSNDYLQHEIELQTANLTQMNNSLVTINKRLTDNEKARKNIMSNLSHDLKTPITAIKGYSQLIQQSNNNPDETSVLSQNIIRRCDQMESLITDIIELSKLDAGENTLKKIPLSLSQILDEIYFLHEDEISRKNKTLNIDIPKNDSLDILGDPLKLSRVFENLLSNSVHYTNDNGIINIKAWRDNEIFVQLSDNGIGIPKEAIPHIFERFYRAKNSGKYIKGTGLGLSIVKLILDNHNAEISVSSKPEQGTTFTIKFQPIDNTNNNV